ncbi:hypothetical protein [Streptomyces guryensis]|uniref:Uncharacterized protein n=1 Tax=Streptomyces guryensis TaxID=2886947 RepID=A0A9Q3VPC1_9ACTN|nr:hypothetical protein [Streptomyces guryensis]MCD9875372.1 hypothetical protein [Streptomyces guryensis]
MSFDLGFWWEAQPITPVEAARKYSAMIAGEVGIANEHPALDVFFGELISRFPDLTEDNFETSPWAAPLYRTSECLIAPISYPRQLEVSEFLLELANATGVTSYDPQSGNVHFPVSGNSVTLEFADGTVINSPSRDDVTRALNGLSPEDWYLILETRPGWFIQVGFGTAAGIPAHSYVLEFRDGSEDEHFRTALAELPQIIDAFHKSLSGDNSWRANFRFSRVSY